MILNCPINSSNVTNNHTMFGTNITGAKGNTVRHKPYRVVMDCVALLKYFIKLHNFVTIISDMMFVNGTPLLITISRGIKFVMVEHIPTCTTA